VLAVGGAVTQPSAEQREHLVSDGLVHHLGRRVLELAPPKVCLAGQEHRALDLGPGDAGLLLGQRLNVVEAADEQQVGDLLDDLQRVADAARPEGVPDAVDLALQLTR
jgi:hypothetical protein